MLAQGAREENNGRLLGVDRDACDRATSAAAKQAASASKNRGLQVLTVKSARADVGNAAYVSQTKEP